MHAGRRFPHRLIAGALVLGALSACVSDRYIGSIGRDGTYVNRGYGFAVVLNREALVDRWSAIDPSALTAAPDEVRPRVMEKPIDLDGDGVLKIGETRRFHRPTFTLYSKTSTGAMMTIDVSLYGKNNARVALDGLYLIEASKLAKTSSTASVAMSRETLELGGFPIVRGELRGGPLSYRMAMIDVQGFIAEENMTRRQVVRVLLAAKELEPALVRDFDVLLEALVLNRRGGTETAQERW